MDHTLMSVSHPLFYVPLSVQLFLWNLQDEWEMLLSARAGHLPPPSCSDIMLKGKDGRVSEHCLLVPVNVMHDVNALS